MKIAITDLADYNEGILRYEWLDLEEYPDEAMISEYLEEFLEKRSKETGELHEEWFISDYDEFPNIGEHPCVEEIARGAELSIDYGWEIAKAYFEMNGKFNGFEEAYNGTHKSEEDFAYELAHECYSLAQLGDLEMYLDWEKYARDLFINDYFSNALREGSVAVFQRP